MKTDKQQVNKTEHTTKHNKTGVRWKINQTQNLTLELEIYDDFTL